jgi:hypothetical protein
MDQLSHLIMSNKRYNPSGLTCHSPYSYLNLGCADRASVVEEPTSNSLLPMDDKQWESGVSSAIQIICLL